MYKEWSPRALIIACLALASASACGERQRDPSGGASSAVSTGEPAPSIARPIGSGAGSTETISPTTSAAAPSASAGADAASIAGTWEGKYQAKKGTVEMPGHVKDTARTADDGKTAAGAGTVSMTIAA